MNRSNCFFPRRHKYLPVAATAAVLILSAQAQAAPGLRLSQTTSTLIEAALATESIANARVGLGVRVLGRVQSPTQFPSTSLPGGAQVLFEQDAAKRFLPASNVKLFTVASALKYLGADFRVSTQVLGVGARLGSAWRGDLFLVGGGDATLSTAGLQKMAREIRKSGIRTISGSIFGDGSRLRAETFGGRYPDAWTLDDAVWYYGPEISALSIDRNQIDISLSPTRAGQLAILKTNAPPDFAIDNRVTTGGLGSAQVLVDRASGAAAISNTLSLSGRLPLGATFEEGVAVPDPPRRAAWILRGALIENGVRISGPARSGVLAAKKATELARHLSPPLSEMAAFCLKPSDNLSAEVILRLTALHAGHGQREGTAARAHSMLNGWLSTFSPHAKAARWVDGSGLGRYNIISPNLSLDLLGAVEKLPPREARALWSALPIAGVDGTLRRRMRNTRAQNNVRAKTGSFSIASSLAGYVTTRDGFRLAVAFNSNFGATGEMRDLQNQIYEALAEAELEETDA
jgi:D-alanyl-D-alanine carboxypeptidase/D-alanyl-D-alanine-endopeptidase (penicillin-binding protein 4)